MRTISHAQGSPGWLAHRRMMRNASEAPAMMGASPYVTRAELIRQKATGIDRDIDAGTQALFDRGHEVEPELRAMAEEIIDGSFYPVTGVSNDGYLGASFDGVTLYEEIILEAKQSNADKLECIARNEIPNQDYWQIVQQFAVCGSAQRCLYIVGDGTEAGTAWMFIERHQVEHDIPKLIASWQQFDADVAAYVPEPVRAEVVASPVAGFGALSLRVEGRVLASNLDAFKADAEAFIARLPKPSELQSDQDFADAEAAVKACGDAEARIKAAREAALAQMADVDSLLRTAEAISESIRVARLALEKAVKAEKENRRADIVSRARAAYDKHVDGLKAETKGVWLPLAVPDFGGAIKGKKSLASMQDAVDTTLANAKIAANESATHIRAALACLSEETADHKHLFPDYQSFISKPIDDIRAMVRGRIAEHKAAEEAKAEAMRERIRKEEQDKLERERAQQNPAAGAPVAQQPLDGAANNAGVATGSRNAPPSESVTLGSLPPSSSGSLPSGARIRLGDINDAIAPLSISADGLAALGFKPAEVKGGAKLYAVDDFPRVCAALAQVITAAPRRAAEKRAA